MDASGTGRALDELKTRLTEIDDVGSANALLYWDQSTYMPPAGAAARARQLATLERVAHAMLTAPEFGRVLDSAEASVASLPPDSDDRALVRIARREYDKAIRLPSEFVSEMASNASASYQAWTVARPADDFAAVLPYLEKTVELSRRFADYFPGYAHIADPLIDLADEGMTAATVGAVFAELRARLVPLVRAVTGQPPADDSCVRGHFPEREQIAFGEEVIGRLGFDFERGRQDKTHHPFMIKFSLGDVRITTRVSEGDVRDALFSTIHEAGHGLYELGIRREYEGLPLANGVSSGVHESQSRLWENLVGRSRGFWSHFYPRLQQVFPAQLRGVPVEQFYRAVNRVERSLIRVDADELTYNLHVLLRFDFELAVLEGKLAVQDLPEAWRARMKEDLGIEPPDDRDGVLQDVHWFGHRFGGMFQGYTLGNILSAQLLATAVRDRPGIPSEIGQGEFGTLRGWLAEHVYQPGAKYPPEELIRRATGSGLSVEPYVDYLRAKYGELYDLS